MVQTRRDKSSSFHHGNELWDSQVQPLDYTDNPLQNAKSMHDLKAAILQ